MNDHVWVGIDNRKSKFVKLTWLGPEAHQSPWPGDMRRFHLLTEFQDYWRNDIETQGTVMNVATCCPSQDSLSILSWLEEQEGFQREVEIHKIPITYRDSYILALSALHRNRARQFAQKAFERANELQAQLNQLQDSLRQLVVTLPCHRGLRLHFPF